MIYKTPQENMRSPPRVLSDMLVDNRLVIAGLNIHQSNILRFHGRKKGEDAHRATLDCPHQTYEPIGTDEFNTVDSGPEQGENVDERVNPTITITLNLLIGKYKVRTSRVPKLTIASKSRPKSITPAASAITLLADIRLESALMAWVQVS